MGNWYHDKLQCVSQKMSSSRHCKLELGCRDVFKNIYIRSHRPADAKSTIFKKALYHTSNSYLDSHPSCTESRISMSSEYIFDHIHAQIWTLPWDRFFILCGRHQGYLRKLDNPLWMTDLFWWEWGRNNKTVEPNGNTKTLCTWLKRDQDIWLSPWPLEKSHLSAGIHASLTGDHWPPTVFLLNFSLCNRQHIGYDLWFNISKLYSSAVSPLWEGGPALDLSLLPFQADHLFQGSVHTRWKPSVWFNSGTPTKTVLTLL